MKSILQDVERILTSVPEEKNAEFIKALLGSKRIFMFGLGRSGLVARMFGMRLVHLGMPATIVGDTTTPAIRAGDLLVICSRTGQSPILRHACNLAHKEDACVVAILGDRDVPLHRHADAVVRLPMEAALREQDQPMGSLFEQALHLYLDCIVLRLMKALRKTHEDMERVHSNLP